MSSPTTSPPGADPPRTEAETPAYAVLRRVLQDGFARGDDGVVDELFAPDLVEHQFGLAGSGPEALRNVKAAIRNLHRVAPDLTITIEDSVQRDDTIWFRVRARGVASGPYFGPASDRPIDITVFDVARVVDGRIAEHWGVPDRFAMLAQTGALDRLA